MYIALVSFCGTISMAEGEVRDIDPSLAEDLLKAGYIKPVEEEKPKKAVRKKPRKE